MMGHLKGGRIENVTKCINTMLRYKNYELQFTMGYDLRKEALKKGRSRVLTSCQLNGSLLIQ